MNQKRLLCLLSALCLCVTFCAMPALAYADVSEQDVYYDAVQTAQRYGLMRGTEEELFDPDGVMSRAMFVTVLGRALGAPVQQYEGKNTFSDVVQGSWYAPYVAWAADKGIASGVGNGRFEPERAVTRQEAAVLILRAYIEAEQGPKGAWSVKVDYSDLAEVSQWAYEGVSFCTLKGVVDGDAEQFVPAKTVTRGAAAVMLATFFDDMVDGLYQSAVKDALNADADEIHSLVTLTKSAPMTTWDSEGRVLMLTWHRYPETYVQGTQLELEHGEVWTFTDKEIRDWYKSEGADAASIVLRLEQLIGLPRDKEYTHVSALWVSTEDLLRPAYNVDVSSKDMKNYFAGELKKDYLEWFDGNIKWSYTESAYPWTRLGYTYDWSLHSDEYGLTEFVIWPGSTVEVEFTKTTQEFIEWLAE